MATAFKHSLKVEIHLKCIKVAMIITHMCSLKFIFHPSLCLRAPTSYRYYNVFVGQQPWQALSSIIYNEVLGQNLKTIL